MQNSSSSSHHRQVRRGTPIVLLAALLLLVVNAIVGCVEARHRSAPASAAPPGLERAPFAMFQGDGSSVLAKGAKPSSAIATQAPTSQVYVPPPKDSQGWIRAAMATAPDNWFECDVIHLYGDGDADLRCSRFDQDSGVPISIYPTEVPCWKAPHPHFVTGGPPSMGFGFNSPDPRDSFIGMVVDGDAGPADLLVARPDGNGGVEYVEIPNADLMTDTWYFPLWIPHVLFPIDAASATIIATQCDLPGYFDGGAP